VAGVPSGFDDRPAKAGDALVMSSLGANPETDNYPTWYGLGTLFR
jgi:hypothetical protein